MDMQVIHRSITALSNLYQELNDNLDTDQCKTDIYQVSRQKAYHRDYLILRDTEFEPLLLSIISQKVDSNILKRLDTLLQDNIHILEKKKNLYIKLDFSKLLELKTDKLFSSKLEMLLKDKELIKEFTYPTEAEKIMLMKETESEIQSLHDEIYNFKKENSWLTDNFYQSIQTISESYLKLIKFYFTDTQTEEKITTTSPNIESDTIFKTKMYDKFLLLEQKLIEDNYLDDRLNWIAKHDNGSIDIKSLVTFLVGLIDNKYFLPNKDPKVKVFFEARYSIKIGQNFEKSRRQSLAERYGIIFHDYDF